MLLYKHGLRKDSRDTLPRLDTEEEKETGEKREIIE